MQSFDLHAPKRFAELPYGLRLVLASRELSHAHEVELGQDLASGEALVCIGPERVDFDLPIVPDPEFTNAERFIDFELVQSATRPDDLDGEVRKLFRTSELVAFVGLHPSFVGLALQGHRSETVEVEPSFLAVSLEEAREKRLDGFVAARWAHQLELSFEVRHSHTRSVAANGEEGFV